MHGVTSAYCASVWLCLAAIGCDAAADSGGGSLTANAGAPATVSVAVAAPAAHFSEIYEMLFPRVTNAHCDMCHGLPAFDQSNGNLSTGMDKASTYQALVDKPSASSKCAGRVQVVPGHPEMSLLLQKVMPNPPCGLRMPNGGAVLSDAQVDLIRSWIAAGAHDD